MDERNSQYRLEVSRNGLTVPVINDVYLHSSYNPEKEAESFAKSQETGLKTKKNVLILGLGFGYHVEEISKITKQFHSEYKIIVLEPNKRLVDDFINSKNFEDKNIQVVCTSSTKELFGNWDFIQFLMNKPCIIKHDASFIIEKDFYSNFLSYQASKDLYNIRSLSNQSTSQLLENTQSASLSSKIDRIKEEGMKNRNDFFLMAFNEISNLNNQGR